MLFPVKICGITREEDAEKAGEAGADYIGIIVNVPASPRNLTLQRAKSIRMMAKTPVVVLLRDPDKEFIKEILNELQPFALQLIGEESRDLMRDLKKEGDCVIWKSLHFPVKGEGGIDLDSALEKAAADVEAGVDALVLDTFDCRGMRGGTGKAFDWEMGKKLVRQINGSVFLAGGITPQNVEEAIEEVRPYGIDLSSGVEISVGKKDAQKINALMNTVRELRKK